MGKGFTDFDRGVGSFGQILYGTGDLTGLAMARSLGKVVDPANTKVIFVDSACTTGNGSGDCWRNAITTAQAGVNKARRDTGTTDINYDDERECFVIVAPGNYAERVAWSGKNIHLIGLGVPGGDSGVTFQPDTPTTYAYACGGPGLEVANIFIKAGSNAVYGFYGSNFENSYAHDMVLYADGVASTGFYIDGTGLKGSRIYDNYVVGFKTAGLSVAADANSYCIHGCIERNTIDVASAGTVGIKVNNGVVCYCFRINHNFVGAGYTASITVDAGQTGILIADNWTYAQPSGGTARDNHYSGAGA